MVSFSTLLITVQCHTGELYHSGSNASPHYPSQISCPFFQPSFPVFGGESAPDASSAPPGAGCACLTGPESERPGIRLWPWKEAAGREHLLWGHPIFERVSLLLALLLVHKRDPGLKQMNENPR